MRFLQMQRMISGTDNSLISDKQQCAMLEFAKYLGEDMPEEGFQLEPLNSIGALIHWKMVMLVSARMDREQRDYWKELFPEVEGKRDLPIAYDSHFHLDRTIHYMNLPQGSSLQDVLAGTPVEHKEEVRLVGTCASFCDPCQQRESRRESAYFARSNTVG